MKTNFVSNLLLSSCSKSCRKPISLLLVPTVNFSRFRTLEGEVDHSSPVFKKNLEHCNEACKTYLSMLDRISKGGPEKAKALHKQRNKLLAKERIEHLCDRGSFFELSPLAGLNHYGEVEVPAGGIITGVGTVHKKHCVVIANDATIKGGTYFPITIQKHLRAQEIALKNRLPCVYLVDSGGGYLPLQADGFADKHHFGRSFYNQAIMSSQRIYQIALVMGSCTAGGAYVPAMSDECIIVDKVGTIFLGGPPLVKAATGAVVTAEELGGAHVHAKQSGLVDHRAKDDAHAIEIARDIFETMVFNEATLADHLQFKKAQNTLYSIDDIGGLVSLDASNSFDVRLLIARLLDGSAFAEFKEEYGTALVTGFGRLSGWPVGVIANNGPLTSTALLKGSHFLQLCEQRRTPILFLMNTFRNSEAEKDFASQYAKMVNGISTATVPKITLITGGCFGLDSFAMCGSRAFAPNYIFTWPQTRYSYGDSNNYFDSCYASSWLWNDGIVLPKDTRDVLSNALRISINSAPFPPQASNFGIFRM